MLQELRNRHGADGQYVFSVSAGRTSFAGWPNVVERIRARCPDLPLGWNVHLFRTAIVTAMGNILDADALVIARLLHHSPEAKLGVTAIYDRSSRCLPMLATLTKWEALLMEAVSAEETRRRSAVAMVIGMIPSEKNSLTRRMK